MNFERKYLIGLFLLLATTIVSVQSALWYMVTHQQEVKWMECPELHVSLDDNTNQLREDEMGDLSEDEVKEEVKDGGK